MERERDRREGIRDARYPKTRISHLASRTSGRAILARLALCTARSVTARLYIMVVGHRCVIFATGLHDGAGLQKAGDAAS